MKERLQHRITEIQNKHRNESKRRRIRSVLAVTVSICVLYALLLPAFTLEKPTFCGKEAHIHSDECYEYVLDCSVTGEKGDALSFEEFMKLPGAAEVLARFEQAEEASEDSQKAEEEKPSPNGTKKDSEENAAVGKSAEPDKSKEDVATSSDYHVPEKDIYLAHDKAGSQALTETNEENTVSEEEMEESPAYAVVNADGAVEDTSIYEESEAEEITEEIITEITEETPEETIEASSDVISEEEKESSVVIEEIHTEDVSNPQKESSAVTEESVISGSEEHNPADPLNEGDIASDEDLINAAIENDRSDSTIDTIDKTAEEIASSGDSENQNLTESVPENTASGAPVAEEQEPEESVPAASVPEETAAPETEASASESAASAHIHTAACYRRVLTCGMEEHEHSLACYSDPNADVESEMLIEDLFPTFEDEKVKDSYEYAAKLAEFQKDYHESVNNYMIIVGEDDEETTQGYTRYGDWAGDPYAIDWNPLFAAFTYDKVGIDLESFDMLAGNAAGHDAEDRDYLVSAYDWMQALREASLEATEVPDYLGDGFNGTDVLPQLREIAAAYLEAGNYDALTNIPEDPAIKTMLISALSAANRRNENSFRDVEGYIDLNFADYLLEDEDGNEFLSLEYYADGRPAAPAIGELVFLDTDDDFDADHVGIISALNFRKNKMTLMAGDIDGRVREEKYDFDDMQVLAYACLPETEEALQRNLEVNGEPEALTDFGEIELESEAETEAEPESEVAVETLYIDDVVAIEGSYYTVTLDIPESAQIPENAEINVEEIDPESSEHEEYCAQAVEALRGVTSALDFARFFDITFTVDGEEIEPAQPIAISISYDDGLVPETGEKKAVHFAESGDVEIISVAADFDTEDADEYAAYEDTPNEDFGDAAYEETEFEDADSKPEAGSDQVNAESNIFLSRQESTDLSVRDSSEESGSDQNTGAKAADLNSDEAFAAALSDDGDIALIRGVKKLGRALTNLIVKDTANLEEELGMTDAAEENRVEAVAEDKEDTGDAANDTTVIDEAPAVEEKTEASSEDKIPAPVKKNEASRKNRAGNAGTADRSTFSFVQGSFSVTGTVVYTVDLHWIVNGKAYEYILPGGTAASLKEILSGLHIIRDEENVETEETETMYSANEFMELIAEVTFSDPELMFIYKVDEPITTFGIKQKMGLNPEYSALMTRADIDESDQKAFTVPDWALLGLKPFTTEEALVIRMTNGEVFSIRVTDAQSDAVHNGDGTVQTISNPAGTTIDFFDYWIDDSRRNSNARAAWPGTVGSIGTGNNSGINASTYDDTHGHALKFTPANAGSVYDGTLNYGGWNRPAADGGPGVNSWTKNANPRQGLVTGTLVDGYPKLSNNGNLGTTDESLAYLFNTDYHAGKEAFTGVDQLLYVDQDGYYKFDSNDFDAQFDTGSKTFTLTDQTAAVGDARGFWPFGTQVYWHGMHMKTQFSMPADGRVLSPTGKYNDMIFEFQGDDDTWVYIDGVLVGDGGGIHNQTFISINFRDGTVTVDGKHDVKADYRTDWSETKYLDDLFRAAGVYDNYRWIDSPTVPGHKTFAPGTYHRFDMFYLERGGGESNLHIRYNLVSTADFTAHKSFHNTNNDRLYRDEFQFEIIGLDGQYKGNELFDAGKRAIMPHGGSASGAGTVASPREVYHEAEGGNPGYTSYITGVSEDGNVNFGQAEINDVEMHDCDDRNPSTYRYIIREIVPGDALNADRKTWAESTDEEKEEGGYVKDGITYDGRTYYMTATVTSWTEDGHPVYGLDKKYYTDDTFTEEDTSVKFASFLNGYVQPLTLKVNKKSNSEKLLSGAQFSLVRAKLEAEHTDGDVTIPEKWIPRPNAAPRTGTTSQGVLNFDNLTEGHYILEETAPPMGYEKNTSSRWLLTLTKEDSENEILLIPTLIPLNGEGEVVGDTVALEVNESHVFEHTVANNKLPRGPLTVAKKWIKPDGTTEYTAEELAELGEDVQNTAVTGELWRRATIDPVTPPTVSIYSRLNNENVYQLRWQEQVEPGSTVSFSMAVNGTGYPINQQYTTDTGDAVTEAGDQDIYYDYISGYQIHKTSGHVFALNNITHDVSIYGVFDSSKTSDNNNPRIGFKMVSYTAPTGNNQPQTIDEQAGSFTLDKDHNWQKTWTSEQLNEGDYDYEYYLKNVSEPSLEGFAFIKEPEITTDTSSGSMTFAVKNIKGGPKTDLTVRKVWGDNLDHSGDSISYKIQRQDLDVNGNLLGTPYDYIETGRNAAEIYTLSASDTYNGTTWQKHHDNLPATNGKEETDTLYRSYQYSVVETAVPQNYSASYLAITDVYNENPYTVSVIKNNPTDARVTIEKKWMNNEQTDELDSGIPEGVYITGILNKSYTWQEATGVTVRVFYRVWQNGQAMSPTLMYTYNDVQDSSSFNLWAVDANGNEPQNGVQVNGERMLQNGPERTYHINNNGNQWDKKTRAFVTTVNGNTDIILDWQYDTGFQTRVYYDVDYTEATGGGESHNENKTVGSFRLDASNEWFWSWTDRELDQDHVYTYSITDVEEHAADDSVVTHYDGFFEPVIGNLTQGTDGKWTAVIKNVHEPLRGNLRITKELTGDIEPRNYQDTVFKVTVMNENGLYLQSDLNSFGNEETELEVTPAAPLDINDIPVGKYTVLEKTGDGYTNIIEGYTWSEEGSVVFSGNAADKSIAVNVNETTTVGLVNPYIQNYTPVPTEFDRYKDLVITKDWVKTDGRNPSPEDVIKFKVVAKYADVDYVPLIWELYENNGSAAQKKKEGLKYVHLNQGITITLDTTGGTVSQNSSVRMESINTLKNPRTDIILLPKKNQNVPSMSTIGSFNISSKHLILTGNVVEPELLKAQPSSIGAMWVDTLGTSEKRWLFNLQIDSDSDEVTDSYDTLEALIQDSINDSDNSMHLKYTLQGSVLSADSENSGLAINPETAESEEPWKAKLTNLPVYQKITVGEETRYRIYSYSVEEVEVNGEPVISGKTNDYTVAYSSSDTSDISGKVTTESVITNTEIAKIDVDIVKVAKDHPEIKLENAVFSLRELEDAEPTDAGTYNTKQGTAPKRSDATHKTGLTSFTGLGSGYYELKETVSPNGYVTTGDVAAYFRISGGEVIWLEFKMGKKPSEWEVKTTKGTEELVSFEYAVPERDGEPGKNATFVIENIPGPSLPSTGGPGTYVHRILGLFLIALAGTLLAWMKGTALKQ